MNSGGARISQRRGANCKGRGAILLSGAPLKRRVERTISIYDGSTLVSNNP